MGKGAHLFARLSILLPVCNTRFWPFHSLQCSHTSISVLKALGPITSTGDLHVEVLIALAMNPDIYTQPADGIELGMCP